MQNILVDYGRYFNKDIADVDIESIYNNYHNKLNGTFPDNFINIIDEALAFATFNNSLVTTEDFIKVAKRNCITNNNKSIIGFGRD